MVSNKLKSRFRLNALSQLYAQAITIAAQLILIPFFIKYWGKETYADWIVLFSIPSILVLIDLGVSQAATSMAISREAQHDRKSTAEILQTALLFVFAICFAVLAIGISAYRSLDLSQFLNLRSIGAEEANTTLLALITYLTINILGGCIEGWYRVKDSAALGTLLFASRRLIDIFVGIIVLTNEGTPTNLAISMAGAQLCALSVFAWLFIHKNGTDYLGIRLANKKDIKSLLKPSFTYMGFPIAQVITLQGSVQVLNSLSDAKTLIAFTMIRTLMRLIIQIGVVISNALRPELSRAIGRGESAKAWQYVKKTSTSAAISATICFLGLVYFSPTIINLWSHGEISPNRSDTFLIGLHAIVNVFWYVPAAFLISANKHTSLAPIYATTSALSLATWLAIPTLLQPINGAALLMAIPEVLTLLFLFRIIRIETRHLLNATDRAE